MISKTRRSTIEKRKICAFGGKVKISGSCKELLGLLCIHIEN